MRAGRPGGPARALLCVVTLLAADAAVGPRSLPAQASPEAGRAAGDALGSRSAFADPPPRFRHLTIADGLSQNAVAAIVQDRRGFMWFGTKDGLNRYDGYEFVIFRHSPFDSTTLSDDDVTALLEDARGRLWVGTRGGGLNRFDRERKAFRRYPEGPAGPITSLAEDANGRIWIGTFDGGLYGLSPDEEGPGAFSRFTHDPRDPGSLADDRVHAVLVDRRGVLWVGTEGGLNRLDAAAGRPRFVRYGADPGAATALIGTRASALLEDREGRLWVGSIRGLTVFDPDRTRTERHYHRYRTERYGWGDAIELLEDRDGRIWVSTHSELMRFDPETGSFGYLRHDPLVPEGINSNAPTALFQDRSGVVWVGTNGYGINVHDPKADRFRTFRRPEDRPYRQSGFSVYTVFEDSGGRIWIDAGLLYRWDRSTGEFKSFETGVEPERLGDFGNTGVWALLEDPPGFLWAGTYQGLFHYEIATGESRRWAHDPADPGGLPEPEVKDIHLTPDGTLWLATENYLARLVDPGRGRFRSWAMNERAVTGRWTFPSLHRTPDGAFWIGSNQGLLRFDPEAETFRRWRNDPRDPTSLGHDAVRSICPDPREPDRYLWIGTAGGGLNRFDLETETFVHYTTRDGLPNDVVYGVLPDDAGNLWLSTNRGLSRFDPRTGAFRNYDAEDGLQSDEFNSGAYFRSESGELFFGGVYGFNYFHPDEIADNPHVPEVVISGFRRNNRAESVRDSGTVLSEAISEAETLHLSHTDDVVTFEFAALDYSAPAKNRYAYRLEGFNDAWIESGSVRSATYTNLPPGRYTFRVRGSNNDGVWNEEGAALAIAVVPPWWRTPWAYGLYGLLFLGGLWALRRYELNRLLLESRLELERVEADKLRAVDRARSRFFADVSHEFRTPLTLTLGPLDDLLTGLHGPVSSAARGQLELARRSAGRVLALIDQILEVARLEAGRTPLRARRMDLAAFVRSVAQGFAPLAERRLLRFEVQAPSRPVVLYGDPEHLEKVLSNLLSNAMKFTPEGGAVRVTVRADEDVARIAVRDSGIGIPAAELPRLFDRFHRVDGPSGRGEAGTGIGLALVKELVELHGGSLTVESEEGFGSTFTVALRRGRSHLSPEQIVAEDGGAPWTSLEEAGARVAGAAAGEAGEAGMARDAGAAPAESGVAGGAHPGPGEAVAGTAERDEAAERDEGADGEDAEPIEPPETDVTTVLVVEDHPDVRTFVRKHLARTYRVLEAEDGRKGLEIARDALPDLVLADVMMPGMDGRALCRALKADPETDFIPVVLLTARAAPEDRLAGLEDRADDYLTKPFDVRELLARVDNLITSRKRLRQRFEGSPPPLTLHPRPVEVESPDRKFLERVRETIEENLGDEDFTVALLARKVAHSRGHLYRRLRELVDESPSDLIRRMRLERAAQLIEAGAGTIGEVAYAVGFKSVSHFSNRFLDHFGVRPSAYPPAGAGPDAEDALLGEVGSADEGPVVAGP